MDSNSIATLKDYQASIETSFKVIDKKLNNFDGLNGVEQSDALRVANKEIGKIKNTLSLMRMQMADLKEEKNETEWQNIINTLQKKNSEYKEKIAEKDKNKKAGYSEDHLDVDAKVDLGKLTAEQAMERGDKILDKDQERLNRMERMAAGDLQTMKQVNVELDRQDEKLNNANKDLTEIDYSLDKAGKQMRDILKIYAKDKMIMCLIIVMLLIIVVIIIISIVKGKKDDKNDRKTAK
ncbi:MAG: hypothetical protein MJ252_24615, partial [archaeon]|nr:hypothetical protein [archaeon]